MKQPPREKEIQDRMQPGRLTLHGMLGNDHRTLSEIIEADLSVVNRLGVTHADIAERMRDLAFAGRAGFGTPVIVDDIYEVAVREDRGVLPCPFDHPGRYPKSTVYLKNLETGKELHWTALGAHMIEAHGFYAGHGARFRIDPARAVKILRIPPRCSV